jgi:hypothetical protein
MEVNVALAAPVEQQKGMSAEPRKMDAQMNPVINKDTSPLPSSAFVATVPEESLQSSGKILQKKRTGLSVAQDLTFVEVPSIPSVDMPVAQSEPDFLRPNFTLRLKPTIAVNDGDKLKLEVRFIAQPEPKVKHRFVIDAFIQQTCIRTFAAVDRLVLEREHTAAVKQYSHRSST